MDGRTSYNSAEKKKGQSSVDLASILRALGDPMRLAVLQALLRGPMHVKDLLKRVTVGQSLLSHPLKVLRQSGLVFAKHDGKVVQYRVAPAMADQDPGAAPRPEVLPGRVQSGHHRKNASSRPGVGGNRQITSIGLDGTDLLHHTANRAGAAGPSWMPFRQGIALPRSRSLCVIGA